MFVDSSNPKEIVWYTKNRMSITPCSECFIYYSSRCRLCKHYFDGTYCTYARCFKYSVDGIVSLLK